MLVAGKLEFRDSDNRSWQLLKWAGGIVLTG